MGRYGEVAIARSGLLIVEEDGDLNRRPRWAKNLGGTHVHRQLHSLGFFSSITRDYYRVFLFSLYRRYSLLYQRCERRFVHF